MIGREISVLDLLRLTPKSLTREDWIRNGCIYRSRIRVPAFCKEIFRNVLQVRSPTIYMTTTAFNVHLDLLGYRCVSIEYFSTPFCSQILDGDTCQHICLPTIIKKPLWSRISPLTLVQWVPDPQVFTIFCAMSAIRDNVMFFSPSV